MPSLPSKLIFPSWCLPSATASDDFTTTIQATLGGESRNSTGAESRYAIDLGGGQCTTEQRRYIRAFVRAVRGRWKTFLFRRYNDDEWELQGPDGRGEYLGTTDGETTQFQARIYDDVQGAPASYIVRWLDHDISPLGFDVYNKPATKTRLAQVWLDDEELTHGVDFTVNRETGIITLSAPAAAIAGREVRLKCGFFVLVRMGREGVPMSPTGNGWYSISDGVALVEPRGGK